MGMEGRLQGWGPGIRKSTYRVDVRMPWQGLDRVCRLRGCRNSERVVLSLEDVSSCGVTVEQFCPVCPGCSNRMP